jgi:hypothetical protein
MAQLLRKLRDRIKQFGRALSATAVLLGVYVAAGTVLLGADWPNKEFWEPWSKPFVLLIIAAVYIPLYAAFRDLDADLAEQDRKRAEETQARGNAVQSLAVLCQQVVAELAARCLHLNLTEVSTQIWLCGEDGRSFERWDDRLRFFLPYLRRKRSGVAWERGKGVAGMAWQRNEDLSVDLNELQEAHGRLGRDAFDALPANARHGMTYGEVLATIQYKGIAAIRLFSTDPTPTLLGMFIVDYTGSGDFECIQQALRETRISILLSGCEEGLTACRASPRMELNEQRSRI